MIEIAFKIIVIIVVLVGVFFIVGTILGEVVDMNDYESGEWSAEKEYATLTSAAGEYHAWLTAVSTPAP